MLVMKFGGISVGCAESITRVCGIVRERLLLRPVVVVSALARVTDELQSMGVLSRDGRLEDAVSLLRAIEARHAGMARALFPGSSREFVEERLRPAFQEAHDLLKAIAAIQELTPRTLDRLLGFGERWSSALVAETFRAHGLAAVLVDAGAVIVTDANHSHATALMDLIKLRVASTVRPLLESGSIPVLGGFIGATTDGVPTTLGRGGSDFTASILGASLEAESIEIWTDVDGMMTTDPRICPDAHRIRTISFEEAAELAYFGAKVLHPATLLPAVQKDIPVYVLNSRNPSCEGTRITARAPQCRNYFKAIAAKRRITIVDVVATRMLMAHGFLKSIFEVFDQHRCPVDMVSTSEVSVSLTVDSTESIPAIAADLEKLADVKYEGRKAIVCLVGENIRGTRGIAAKVFGALPETSVRMISQGASEINISFVIDEDDVDETVRTLHRVFFADPDPAVFA